MAIWQTICVALAGFSLGANVMILIDVILSNKADKDKHR